MLSFFVVFHTVNVNQRPICGDPLFLRWVKSNSYTQKRHSLCWPSIWASEGKRFDPRRHSSEWYKCQASWLAVLFVFICNVVGKHTLMWVAFLGTVGIETGGDGTQQCLCFKVGNMGGCEGMLKVLCCDMLQCWKKGADAIILMGLNRKWLTQ